MSITRKVVQVAVIAFVTICAGIPAFAQDVFDAMPADAVFAVRMNNFEYTLGQIDQFLTGLAPAPNIASMLGRMQIGNVLGDPNLAGVNLQGQLAVFGMATPGEPNAAPKVAVYGLIPVTDYKTFVSSNHTATKPDTNGVGTIGQMKMLVAKDANFAILAKPDEYAALVGIIKTVKTKNLASSLNAAQRSASAKARIWAYGDVRQVRQLYGTLIYSKMQDARNAMAANDPNMVKVSQVMNIYVDMIKSVMNDSKNITIAINPKADSLGLTGTLTALPDTELAKTLTVTAAKGPDKLLGWLQDGAVMNSDSKIDKPALIAMYRKIIDAWAPMAGPTFTAEEKAKMLTRISDTVNSLGSEIACSIVMDPNSNQPFNLSYVFEVSDVSAFRKGVDDKIETLNAPYMKDFFKNFGIQLGCEFKRDAEKYNGISIDTVNVKIDSVDPNNKMGQMATKMYGQNITGRMAIINGLAIYTAGAKADSRIKSMIDTAKAGGPKTINSEIKTAMALIPDSNNAQLIGTYNYMRAIQCTAGFMPNMPFDANALRQIVTKSDIAFDGNIGSGDIALTLVVPKQHIMEIKSAFETVNFKQGKPRP